MTREIIIDKNWHDPREVFAFAFELNSFLQGSGVDVIGVGERGDTRRANTYIDVGPNEVPWADGRPGYERVNIKLTFDDAALAMMAKLAFGGDK